MPCKTPLQAKRILGLNPHRARHMGDNELLDEDRVATRGKSRSKRAVKAATTDETSEQANKRKQAKTSSSTQRSLAGKKRKDTVSDHQPGESDMYRISYRIALAWCTRLHERSADEPLYRRLQVYSINPGADQTVALLCAGSRTSL